MRPETVRFCGRMTDLKLIFSLTHLTCSCLGQVSYFFLPCTAMPTVDLAGLPRLRVLVCSWRLLSFLGSRLVTYNEGQDTSSWTILLMACNIYFTFLFSV